MSYGKCKYFGGCWQIYLYDYKYAILCCLKLLGSHCDKPGGIHKQFQQLLSTIHHPSNSYDLNIVNRIYGSNSYDFKEHYIRCLKEIYNSGLESADFMNATEKVTEKINSWVESQTNGAIKNFYPANSIDPSSPLVLVNAVNFKGMWRTQFNPKDTHRAVFWTRKITKKLSYKTLQEWTSSENMRQIRIKLCLPKFSVEDTYSMKPILMRMGVKDLFISGRADLSGISGKPDLFVADFKFKGRMKISEDGSDAAGASRAEIVCGSDAEVNVNNPFICFLRHNSTGIILFIIRICVPE
ncbi:hypothetical protein Chor_003163 [Crotalus horridus]